MDPSSIFLPKLAADRARYLGEYSERFENVLNADDAAPLFAECNADRARFRVAVHPAATWVRDELFRPALAQTPPDVTRRVVFTAGRNAVGKSSALAYSQAGHWAHVVFDSTFSSAAHARRLIDRALAADWPNTVVHVDRRLEDAFVSMLERARGEGRVVGIEQMIHSHRGAAETVGGLADGFRHHVRCDFRFLVNSAKGIREGSIELTGLQD